MSIRATLSCLIISLLCFTNASGSIKVMKVLDFLSKPKNDKQAEENKSERQLRAERNKKVAEAQLELRRHARSKK